MKKFTILPTITKDKITKERVLELVRVLLYTCCFIGIIMQLCEYGNRVFQTQKDFQGALAILFFAVILWVMQRVKLFNIPSLIVTLIYAVYAVFHQMMFVNMPDIHPTEIISLVEQWMLLMVVTDMMVTKRIRNNKKIVWGLFALLVATAVYLFVHQKDSGIAQIFPFLIVFFLIPVKSDEWDRVVNSLCNAGFLCTWAVLILSLILNPIYDIPEGDRWYGYFLNIGDFGQFQGLSFALAVYCIFKTARKYGRLSFAYMMSWSWLLTDLAMVAVTITRNLWAGVAVILMVMFIIGFKKTNKKHILIRVTILAVLFAAILIGLMQFSKFVYSDKFPLEWAYQIVEEYPYKAIPGFPEFIGELRMLNVWGGHPDKNIIPPYTFMAFLNKLSSSRLQLWVRFLEEATFEGQGSGGMIVREYFAYNAHNEYVQVLYEYGFLAGGVLIIFVLTSWVVAIVRFAKDRKGRYLLPVLMISMMVGMWIGERSSLYYPLTFMGFLCMLPGMVDYHGGSVKGGKGEEEGERESE